MAPNMATLICVKKNSCGGRVDQFGFGNIEFLPQITAHL